MRYLPAFLALALGLALPTPGSARVEEGPAGQMVRIPAGSYSAHYSRDGRAVEIQAFELDRRPVTRSDYLGFLRDRAEWRRSEVKALFAGPAYLSDWPGDLDFGGAEASRLPVTNVSWFAARAYCQWRGARLPTTDEWEYVASASETRRDASADPAFIQRLVDLATMRTVGKKSVGSGFRNVYGVEDLHGLGWEWVLDFNNILVSDDSRSGNEHDRGLYCAAGGIAATNATNYPAFLRYAMRAGLDGRSTVGNLGFRCARSL